MSHYVTLISELDSDVFGDVDTVSLHFHQVVIIFQPSGFNGVWLAQSRMGFHTLLTFPGRHIAQNKWHTSASVSVYC